MPRYFDVTIPIRDGMTVYPGDIPVSFRRTHVIERDGYNWSELHSGTHVGTHMDAPVHFSGRGKTLSEFPIDLMIGEVTVIETGAEMITSKILSRQKLRNWNAVFFKTKNQRLWARKKFSRDYVSLTSDAAAFLVKKGTMLVGIDYRSIETFYTHSYPVHKILCGNNVFIIEGLYLNNVKPGRYKLYCLPLKLDQADGGPVRVILI